jgi:hypothetical protein
MAYDIMVRERSRVTSSSQNIFCFCIPIPSCFIETEVKPIQVEAAEPEDILDLTEPEVRA